MKNYNNSPRFPLYCKICAFLAVFWAFSSDYFEQICWIKTSCCNFPFFYNFKRAAHFYENIWKFAPRTDLEICYKNGALKNRKITLHSPFIAENDRFWAFFDTFSLIFMRYIFMILLNFYSIKFIHHHPTSPLYCEFRVIFAVFSSVFFKIMSINLWHL